MFQVILWAVLNLFLLTGVFISGLLSCFLKDRARLVAVDSLLILSTLMIAAFMSASFLPKEFIKGKSAQAFATEPVQQSDLVVNGLNESSYLDDLPEPLHSWVSFEVGMGLKKALDDVENKVKTLLDKYPNEPALASRLAIILHSENKNAEPVFEKYYKAGGKPDSLLDSLRELYNKPESTNEKKYISIFQTKLPHEWYQQTALIDVYKISDDTALEAAYADRKVSSMQWRNKYTIYLVVRNLFALLGIFAIAWFLRANKILSQPIPLTTEFRRMYACLISVLFAQVIVAAFAAIALGLSSTISHRPIAAGSYKFVMTAALVVSGVCFSFLIVYLLICRPQSISIWQTFVRSAEKLKAREIMIICAGGFCSMSCLSLLARYTVRLIPGIGESTNSAMIEILNAFFSGSAFSICWSIFLACFVAPLTEELLFRGLVFGWLRYKTGVVPAIIGSSISFSLYHFDPNGFLQYFVMGVVFSSIYERTRNLWICAAVHGLWNFWVVVSVWWLTVH